MSRPGFVCVGPLLVDVLRFADGRPPAHEPGGNAVIVAAAAAARGTPVTLVGQVGDDPTGAELRGALAARGVDVRHLGVLPERATKRAHLEVAADGGWRWVRSSPRRFPYLRAPFPYVPRPGRRHLHLAGLPPLLRAAPEATRRAVAGWRAAGGTVSVGLARFDDDERDAIRELLAPDDGLFATAEEVAQLTGRSRRSFLQAAELCPHAPTRHWVVTFGADGAAARWGAPSEPVVRRAAPARRAVNTVGAGDILNGTSFYVEGPRKKN